MNSSLPAECANPNVEKQKYLLSIFAESHSFAAEAAEIALKYLVCLYVCICPHLITTFWVLHILQEGVLKASSSQKYCQTPDQTKIKIQSNQKSGEALYLGSRSFVVRRNAGYNLLIPF